MSIATYARHPIFSHYMACSDGNVFEASNFNEPIPVREVDGTKLLYIKREDSSTRYKHYSLPKFVYECFNGVLPRNETIQYKDLNIDNNSLSNLEPVSQKISVQLRTGYKDNKFEQLDQLPEDSRSILGFKKNGFDNFYYSPSTDSFYVKCQDKYVKKQVDKYDRIHVMNTNGKTAHIKVSAIKKLFS